MTLSVIQPWILTASKAGLMATQHSFQKSPGVKPSMALTSWENLWIPATGESAHSPGIPLGTWVQGYPHRHSTLCSIPAWPGATHSTQCLGFTHLCRVTHPWRCPQGVFHGSFLP